MLNYLFGAAALLIFAWLAYEMTARWHRGGRPPMSPIKRVIALVAFGGGIYVLLACLSDFTARRMDIYAEGLQRAATSKVFAEQIGEPYEVKWPIILRAEKELSGPSGDAAFDAKVEGPHGRGHLIAAGKRVGGVWHLTQLDIVPSSSGKYLSLLPLQTVPD